MGLEVKENRDYDKKLSYKTEKIGKRGLDKCHVDRCNIMHIDKNNLAHVYTILNVELALTIQ